MSRVVNHASDSVLSPVANSTGATPGRANARKAATSASASPLAETTVAAGAQTQASPIDKTARISRHESGGQSAWVAPTLPEGRAASATAANDDRAGCSPNGLALIAVDRRPLLTTSF